MYAPLPSFFHAGIPVKDARFNFQFPCHHFLRKKETNIENKSYSGDSGCHSWRRINQIDVLASTACFALFSSYRFKSFASFLFKRVQNGEHFSSHFNVVVFKRTENRAFIWRHRKEGYIVSKAYNKSRKRKLYLVING